MPARYTLILRECSETAKAHVAQFLGRAFSLKDATCQTIAGSTPIALLSDLSPEEAAAMQLVMGGLAHDGVVIEYSAEASDELPKIDWPRRPAVFKREIPEYVEDFRLPVACPDCRAGHPLLDLLMARLGPGEGSAGYTPAEAPKTIPANGAISGARTAVSQPASKEFKGAHLPEITPFATPVLPQPPTSSAAKPPTAGSGGTKGVNRTPMPPPPAADADVGSRLNELFPEEEGGGFIPDNSDITSILNRLLPDEEGGGGGPAAPGGSSSSNRLSSMPVAGFSVFLAKIGDEARRQKAVPIIAELGRLSTEEAEALSKKVIIPVLKGVSKEEAEAAKQKFAKIGILARVKGAETAA